MSLSDIAKAQILRGKIKLKSLRFLKYLGFMKIHFAYIFWIEISFYLRRIAE